MKTTKTTTTEVKRQARKKATAEDFTPAWLVNQMLDKLKEYSPESLSNPYKTFLDPACGNGNMLVEVLKRKLAKFAPSKDDPSRILASIYGCDIMIDNINECRLRLFKVLFCHIESLKKYPYGERKKIYRSFLRILARNIVCTPLNKYPNGSLDYLSLPEDETFNRNISDEQVEKTIDKIFDKNLLDAVQV